MRTTNFPIISLLTIFIGLYSTVGITQTRTSLAWQLGSELPVTRAESAAVLASDQSIHLIGGHNSSISRIVSKLLAGDSTWTSAPNLDTSRFSPGAVRYGSNGILVIGGTGGGEASDEVLNYDYRFGDSQDVTKMLVPRRKFAFAADSLGASYAIGGLDDNNDELFSAEFYDANLDLWIQIDDLPAPNFSASAIGDNNGNVFVFGGMSNGSLVDSAFCYIAIEGSWVELASMPEAVRDSVAVYYDGYIFVLGGVAADGPTATVQVYDLATGLWSIGTELPEARYSHAAVIDSLEQIVVMGGYNSNGVATSSVYQSQRLNTPEILPSITSSPVQTASLDQFYSYTVTAIGNPNPLFFLDLAPLGMTISAVDGTISWQPLSGQEGFQDVVVLASNRAGNDEQVFTVAVATDTISPTIPTALQVDAVTTTSVDLSWTPASDANGVDHYNLFKTYKCGWRHSKTCYTLVKENIPQANTTVTGLAPLSWFSYVVRAIDAAGNSSSNSNKVSSQTLSEPIGFQYRFNGQVGGLVSVPAKTLLELQLVSSANPAATYSMLSGPQGILVDPISGFVQWTPSVADVGTDQIVVEASNTLGSSSLNIDITVRSDVPQLTVAINPASSGLRYAVAGVPFMAQLSDASNTPPTYAIISAPSGMTIDAASGLINWLPEPSQAGTTNVTVRSTSSAGSTDLSFTFYTHFTGPVSNIQITNLTELHPTASWVPPIGVGADLVQGYTLVAIAKYRYGSRLNRTHRVSYDLPGTGAQIELTGLVTGRNYKLSINAYDTNDNRGLVNPIPAEVIPRPDLPNLRWSISYGTGASYVVADQPVIIQLTDTNTSSSSTYSIVNAPANFILDEVTGEAHWTPSVADIGSVPITLRATNAVGQQDITININVLFSGPVQQASATRVSGAYSATSSWLFPDDNVVPVVNYKFTMHWTWSGRKRSRTTTISGTSFQFSLSPTGSPISHKGVSITPIDALGRLGMSTFVAYGTVAAPLPTNQFPVANAGLDQSIALPHTTVTLNGSATDDGLPTSPGQLTYLWSVVSAPGAVSFGNSNQASTTVSFSNEGIYTLRLIVSDGLLSHQDVVIITVNPAPVPINTLPIANAGLDQVITLPANSISLNGSASDDGLPVLPGLLTYRWSIIDAPGAVVFGNANLATTTANFSIDGAYTLQLTVSDGLLNDTDNILIVVQPEPTVPDSPPPFDPNSQSVELQGAVQEVGSSYIVVRGFKVWYTADSVVKFEDGNGSTFQMGQKVELKGSKNNDGSITARKIQVGG